MKRDARIWSVLLVVVLIFTSVSACAKPAEVPPLTDEQVPGQGETDGATDPGESAETEDPLPGNEILQTTGGQTGESADVRLAGGVLERLVASLSGRRGNGES